MTIKVPVYDRTEIITRVEYNSNLDHWDGHNWTAGGIGQHLGITKLKKRNVFVLIHGSQMEGARGYGLIVSDKEALQAILKAKDEDLLNRYFPDYQDEEEE